MTVRKVHVAPVAAVCLCAMIASLTHAVWSPQPAPSAPSAFRRTANERLPGAAYVERAEFGWNGHVGIERWNPITVWIADGGTGFSGVLSVTLAQDATQQCRIVVPAATTPGQVVPVELAAAIPREFAMAEFALIDQSGRPIDRVEAVVTYPDRDQVPLELTPGSFGGPIVSIGPSSVIRTRLASNDPLPVPTPQWQVVESQRPPPIAPAAAWLGLRAVTVPVDRAPRAAIAYDGTSAVVVHASTLGRMEARARDALRQWLISGGRVALVIDGPGAEWRTVLPDLPEFDLVNVAESATIPVPADMARALAVNQEALAAAAQEVHPEAGRASAGPTGLLTAESPEGTPSPSSDAPADARPGPDAGDTSGPATGVVAPAESIHARLISLTPSGVASAWSVTHGLDGAGIIASGPAGLGRLTMIGVDPERLTAVVSRDANTAAWLHILRDVAQHSADRRPQVDDWLGSGDTVDQARSIQAGLNDLALERGPNLLIFLPVLGSAVLLALLIGPVDAVILGRLHARQRSWATALGWTALLSAVAAWLPTAVRTAPTTLDRVEIMDVKAPLNDQSPPVASTTGLTSVFAGKAGDVEVSGFPAGSSVRGVSATIGQASRWFLPPMTMLQATRQTADRQALTTAPQQLWVGQWTMRAMLDQAPIDTALGGRIDVSDPDNWKLVLWGLPTAAIEGPISAEFSGQYRFSPLVPEQVGPDGRLDLPFPSGSSAARPAATAAEEQDWTSQRPARDRPQVLENLPGAIERSRAIADLVASGRWAVVRFSIKTSLTPIAAPDYPDVRRRWTYVRICLPIQGPFPEFQP